MSVASEIEARLRAHTMPGLEIGPVPGLGIGPGPGLGTWGSEFVLPHYQGLGIANLPATIAALLGAELPGACPPLERNLWAGWQDGLKRVVLVVLDALGYLQLQAAMAASPDLVFHRLARAGRLVPITSTFPSTTNTVLTTLWTGYSPAAHGILAYELYLREVGVAASALFFWPIHYRQRDSLADWGLEAEGFVPVPGLAGRLADQGIDTYGLIDKSYGDSFLSRIHRRGVKKVPGFSAAADMWLGLQRLIQRHPRKRMFLSAYWDTLDGITHQYGPDDAAWDMELHGISWMMERAFLDRLTPAQREGTLLLVTADHGGLRTPPRSAIQLEQHAALRDALTVPPVGESRVPFLYTRPDTMDAARSYMQEQLGEAFLTLTREQVLDGGLLGPGPLAAETPHRLGDLVGVARGDHYLARNGYQLKMLGRHGGLSPAEMLVPLLGVRLDAL